MNFLQQITNPLIDNSKNKFRVVVKRLPSQTYGTESFYNKKISFDVPKENNNLCGIWIKVSARTAAETASIQLYAGDYHFRRITLQTKNGIVISTNTTNYYDIRSDELANSSINQSLSNAVSPTDNKLTTSTRSFFVPFHSFMTENREKSLPVKHMEELELVCISNTSKETMGLDQELTLANYECYFVYFDDVEPKGFEGMVMEAYDIYEEPDIPNTAVSTSLSTLLTCPYPVFATHLIVKEDTIGNYTNIDNIKLEIAGNTIIDIDDRIIFDLFTDSEMPSSISTNESEQKHYYWGKHTGYKARHMQGEYMTFKGSCYPSYLTLTLNSADAADKLHVLHEYKYILEIDKSGKVSKLSSDNLIFNKNYNV